MEAVSRCLGLCMAELLQEVHHRYDKELLKANSGISIHSDSL